MLDQVSRSQSECDTEPSGVWWSFSGVAVVPSSGGSPPSVTSERWEGDEDGHWGPLRKREKKGKSEGLASTMKSSALDAPGKLQPEKKGDG
ncbi:hypothetical protein EYF80_054031 [Liparis tanakae]|uniref:Uncharacterized protein n=1 Tax=Liparis tanakae TaxID=230148 RepID=A0A4Z2F3S8_9TELE|nr:hypothetical protein EYF80_054031 [Liparis tanakae]